MLKGLDWQGTQGASTDALNELKKAAPVELPSGLMDLLRHSNGGEGPLPVQPLWFVLYSAEEIIEIEANGQFKEFFDALFVFGGNGGGEAIALDLRRRPSMPVVSFDMTNCDLEESVWSIAPDFSAFLSLVGRNECHA